MAESCRASTSSIANGRSRFMCRSGGRSLRVAHFLAQNGFARVSNLTGGILAWGERIDPSLRPY